LGENYPLELGAEFIHGSKTVTMDLCKQAGLTLIPVERKKKMWWADGAQGPAVPVHQLPVSLQEELQKLHQDYDNLSQAVLQVQSCIPNLLSKTFVFTRGVASFRKTCPWKTTCD